MKPIVLCGPTASGKTELALALAKATGGHVVSADSRQVYKRLTAGTAKPAGHWQNGAYRVDGVPYHLVDFLDVTDTFNAGAFRAQAAQLSAAHPNTPLIFAGGTGMWLHAYFVGMDELPAGTEQTRQKLTALAQQVGKQGLHNELQRLDPISAAQIPAGNIQRVMRALELYLLTGKPASELKSGRFFKLPDSADSLWVYLDWEKEALHLRIKRRTEQIFDAMAEETCLLLNEGYAENTPALKSLGYPQAIAFLRGELSRTQAVERVETLTRQYAKRQRTWFNRYTQALNLHLTRAADFNLPLLVEQILTFAKQ